MRQPSFGISRLDVTKAGTGAAGSVPPSGDNALRAGTLDDLAGQGRQHHTLSRLASTWRLKGVASSGCVEETGLRLPPLRPGESFADRYEVLVQATACAYSFSHLSCQA